jgi:hypothetical protein
MAGAIRSFTAAAGVPPEEKSTVPLLVLLMDNTVGLSQVTNHSPGRITH